MKKSSKNKESEKSASMLKKILIRILEILLLILLIGFLISVIGRDCNGCSDDDSKDGFWDKLSDKLNEMVGLGDGKTLFDIELPFELNGIFDIFKGPSDDKVSDDKDGDGIIGDNGNGDNDDTDNTEKPGETPDHPSGDPEKPSEVKYMITFVVDGATYHTLSTPANAEVDMPENPVKEGFQFISWYFDEGVWKDVFDPRMPTVEPLTKDITLYARFHELVGGEGDEGETGGEGGNTGTEEGGGNEGGSGEGGDPDAPGGDPDTPGGSGNEGGGNEGGFGEGEGGDPDNPNPNPDVPGGDNTDGDGEEGDGEGNGDGKDDGYDTDGDHTADTVDNSETIENEDGLTLDHVIDTSYLNDNREIVNEQEDYSIKLDGTDTNDPPEEDDPEEEEHTFAIRVTSERAIYGVSISFELTQPLLNSLVAYYYDADGQRVDVLVQKTGDNSYTIFVSSIELGRDAVLEIYITSSDENNQSIKVTELIINTDMEYPEE